MRKNESNEELIVDGLEKRYVENIMLWKIMEDGNSKKINENNEKYKQHNSWYYMGISQESFRWRGIKQGDRKQKKKKRKGKLQATIGYRYFLSPPVDRMIYKDDSVICGYRKKKT